jgi:imidazolonepropionase-like amidohydrolase
MAFVGTIWTGGDAQPQPGLIVVDGAGVIRRIDLDDEPELPRDLLVVGGKQHWVLPGLVDAHVHLGFDQLAMSGLERDVSNHVPTGGLDTGVLAVRDLGAPLRWAGRWQTGHGRAAIGSPAVAIAGPVLTAPGGYPSRTWGIGGFCTPVYSAAQARTTVQRLASEGVDLIKVALEPGPDGDLPVPDATTLRAIVGAAHSAGLPVVAHALTASMVRRALDAGVDELAHTPTDRLDVDLIERIAAAGMSITTTLQTFFSGGVGREAADNATDLVTAGVTLRYGTDLGNAGTHTGADPRELDRIADTGLGRLGALRAATVGSANAAGMRHRTGLLTVGESAALVLLPSSPLAEPGVWRTPAAVYVDGRLTVGAGSRWIELPPTDLPPTEPPSTDLPSTNGATSTE